LQKTTQAKIGDSMLENQNLHIAIKSVEDIRVAYIHFLGQPSDIPAYFTRLHEEISPYIAGDELVLYDRMADENPQAGRNIEVCYPVSQPVDAGEVHSAVRSKVLPGCQVTYVAWRGEAGAAWGPANWWKSLSAYLGEAQLAIDEDPLREIHHLDEDGTETVELQAVLQFPRWLDNLAAGLESYAGPAVRQQVMAGSQRLTADSPMEQRLVWVQEAMLKLDTAVSDPWARCRILNGCAHRFPTARIAKMRLAYERLGDIDALLDLMRTDQSVGGKSWYENLKREGYILYVTKDPIDPEAYARAQNDTEKRAAACFCGVGRAAILAEQSLSPTYCNCGGGWYVQLWEAILQQSLRVEVLESVLQGGNHCRFAIHLPEDILPGK
jgi:effector-binding domain-containing protein